jgi:hypothetical protein
MPYPSSKPSYWRKNHLATHLIGVIAISVFVMLIWQRQWFVEVSNENGGLTNGYSPVARISMIVLSFLLAFYAFIVLTLAFDWMKPRKYTSFYGQVLKTARTTRDVIDYAKLIVFLPFLMLLALPSLMTDFASIDSDGISFNRNNSWINPRVTQIPFNSIQQIEVREGSTDNDRRIVFYLKGSGSQPVQAPPLLVRMDGIEARLRDASKRNRIVMNVKQ